MNYPLQALADLSLELERLAAAVRQVEGRVAGSLDPGTSELLARLASAAQHLQGARNVLAGTPGAEAAQEGEHLQGSSRAVPIQDLLSFFATTKKSGILRVEAEHERFLLQLREGAVMYASGDAPPPGEALKELLAARGVSSAELVGELPECAAEGTFIDRQLVGTSWISRDSLAGAIQEQTRLCFFRLCSARDTRFRFYEGAEIQNVIPVRQSAMELLLEYSRAVDESRGLFAARAEDRERSSRSLRSAS